MAKQPMLVGNVVLIAIDIQKSAIMDVNADIPVIPGYAENLKRARSVVEAAHDAGTPVIFFQEIHQPNKIDCGSELDGTENTHWLLGESGTSVDVMENDMLEADYLIMHKRRYSCFFDTELKILLNAFNAKTLVLVGGITDVCVHYTFADAHQSDYHVHVVKDCVNGTSPEAHQASLNAMEYLQAGALRSTEEIINKLHDAKSAAA